MNFIKEKLDINNNSNQQISNGIMDMPSVSDGNFEIFQGLPPDVKEIKERMKAREQDIEFKQKKIIESVKSDYVKFLYNDEETLNGEIANLKKKISNLIDKDKYEAVEILKERLNFLESKIKTNEKINQQEESK